MQPSALVIGSDQVATFDGQQIGKPGTHENAVAQLRAMRGRSVEFHSALCLFDSRTGDVAIRRYRHARAVSPTIRTPQIETYLRAETPYDCAGSAKSEGLGIALLDAIDSDDPTALIGLPLIALTGMLRERRISGSGGGMSGVLYLIPNTLGEGDADGARARPARTGARAGGGARVLHRRKRQNDARVS